MIPPLIEEIAAWAAATGDLEGAAWVNQWHAQSDAAREEYGVWAERLSKWLAEHKPDVPKTDLRKMARQTARAKLPNETATRIVVTMNARAWRHFLEQRGAKGADAEIRGLALEALAKLSCAAPNLFGDYRVADGEIQTLYRKV